MRLWTLHPKYLDSKGLVALWREGLLAQAVLKGETHGYRHHPQLTRFRETAFPLASIQYYLRWVHSESVRRGFRFDMTKTVAVECRQVIVATRGQLDYEWQHLQEKLRLRAPAWLAANRSVVNPDPHPLFSVVPGPVEAWEVGQFKRTPEKS